MNEVLYRLLILIFAGIFLVVEFDSISESVAGICYSIILISLVMDFTGAVRRHKKGDDYSDILDED